MSADPFIEQLSDYIDAELSSAEREKLDAHLRSCANCQSLLEELRAVRREAKTLARHEPPEHVWQSISATLESRRRAGSRRSQMQTGLAVAAALVLGVSLWMALRPVEPAPSSPAELANMVNDELRAAETHYENAISGLEQIIEQNEGTLPSELNQTLTENLDLIENAIDESRRAMATDPESSAAQESLLEAFKRKVSLLQNTILLINEVRKGEGENALDLIDEIRDSEESPNQI